MPPTIRLACNEDVNAIAKIYAPFCVGTAISFEMAPPSAEEMAERIENVTRQLPWLVLEDEGQIKGYAYSSLHRERAAYRWSVDASAYVDKAFHRQGIGRALYTSLFEILRLQGYFRVHAGITLPNAGSVGLHEAMGFRQVGIYERVGYKMGKWHDVAWYQLTLRDAQPDPSEPLTLDMAKESSRWHDALTAGMRLLLGREESADTSR